MPRRRRWRAEIGQHTTVPTAPIVQSEPLRTISPTELVHDLRRVGATAAAIGIILAAVVWLNQTSPLLKEWSVRLYTFLGFHVG